VLSQSAFALPALRRMPLTDLCFELYRDRTRAADSKPTRLQQPIGRISSSVDRADALARQRPTTSRESPERGRRLELPRTGAAIRHDSPRFAALMRESSHGIAVDARPALR